MRGESSKSSRRQRMAAQLTVRKHSLHHTARGGACVGVRGLDVKQQQQKKTSLENGVFESFPLRKIKWSKSEREREGYKGKTGEGVKGARKGKGVRKVKGAPNTMAHIQ